MPPFCLFWLGKKGVENVKKFYPRSVNKSRIQCKIDKFTQFIRG